MDNGSWIDEALTGMKTSGTSISQKNLWLRKVTTKDHADALLYTHSSDSTPEPVGNFSPRKSLTPLWSSMSGIASSC